MGLDSVTYKRLSENAIELQWPSYGTSILEEREKAARIIQDHYGDQVVMNGGYCSLLVLFKNKNIAIEIELPELKSILKTSKQDNLKTGFRTCKIPVWYDETSKDLQELSRHCHLSVSQIIELHQNSKFQVEFIGFLPGFPYLSGLPESLHIPRKATPDRSIPAGSVAIAAGQCGIYPQNSPGGWYVLGRSPLSFFDATLPVPNLLRTGDQVSFFAINADEFERWSRSDINFSTYFDD